MIITIDLCYCNCPPFILIKNDNMANVLHIEI